MYALIDILNQMLEDGASDMELAVIEATVASEGPKNLAGLAAEALELEEVASAHHTRLEREAGMLALLRATLREAGEAAA